MGRKLAKQWEMGRKNRSLYFQMTVRRVCPPSLRGDRSSLGGVISSKFPAAQPTVQLSRCQKSLDRRRSGVQATETEVFILT